MKALTSRQRGGVEGWCATPDSDRPAPGEQVALQYSGAAEGRPLPMVLEIVVGAVDRGACIRDLSQYPGEVEYLWVPCSFIAPEGPPRFSTGADGLVVRVFPVRVNANLSSRTVEELLGQKKRAHVAAFRFLVGEVRRDLAALAEAGGAAARLAGDATARGGPAPPTVGALLGRIEGQCEERLRAHEARAAREYAEDGVFRGLVGEMLDARRFAVSKLRLWLEDRTEYLGFVLGYPLRDAHRRLTAFLARSAARAGGAAGERRAAALEVCRARGLVRGRIDEANDAGEAPLVAAAADGAAAADIRRLIAAAGEPSRGAGGRRAVGGAGGGGAVRARGGDWGAARSQGRRQCVL